MASCDVIGEQPHDPEVARVGGAIELKPGCSYVIEMESYASASCMENLRAAFLAAEQRHGCRFLVLDKGLRIARVLEVTPSPLVREEYIPGFKDVEAHEE